MTGCGDASGRILVSYSAPQRRHLTRTGHSFSASRTASGGGLLVVRTAGSVIGVPEVVSTAGATGFPPRIGPKPDRIAAELISPYPPGVPVIAPGEVITSAVLDYLTSGTQAGMLVPDADPELISIRVVAR